MAVTNYSAQSMEYFSNQTSSNSTGINCETRDTVLRSVVFPILYALLFLLGLLLNCLAMWVFLSISSRSPFIIYLKNIVVADFITTLTFPFKILSDSNMASVGLRIFVCSVSSVLFYITMYISIIFFGLISIDRCRKTIQPFASTSPKNLVYHKILSGIIWGTQLTLSIPNMVLTSKNPDSESFNCSDLKTPLGLKWHEVVNYICQVIFWTNLVAVVVCYTLITKELYSSYARTQAQNMIGQRQERKNKVRLNVFLVLAVFFISFVPFHFVRVPYTLSQAYEKDFDCWQKQTLSQLKESTLWLSSLNSLLDPLIYFFLCRSFRDSLFKVLQLSPGRCKTSQSNTETNPETKPIGNMSTEL